MKNLFIIHSYNGDTKLTFGPHLESVALDSESNVYFPDFPVRESISIENWTEVLDQYLELLNEDSVIVAHSFGAHFIPIYLRKRNIKLDKYISVSGFVPLEDKSLSTGKAINDFVPSDEDFKYVKNNVNSIYCIYSDKDHIASLNELELYADVLGAEKLMDSKIGHAGKRSNVREIPVLEEIVVRSEINGRKNSK